MWLIYSSFNFFYLCVWVQKYWFWYWDFKQVFLFVTFYLLNKLQSCLCFFLVYVYRHLIFSNSRSIIYFLSIFLFFSIILLFNNIFYLSYHSIYLFLFSMYLLSVSLYIKYFLVKNYTLFLWVRRWQRRFKYLLFFRFNVLFSLPFEKSLLFYFINMA